MSNQGKSQPKNIVLAFRELNVLCTCRAKALGPLNTPKLGSRVHASLALQSQGSARWQVWLFSLRAQPDAFIHSHVCTSVHDKRNGYRLHLWASQWYDPNYSHMPFREQHLLRWSLLSLTDDHCTHCTLVISKWLSPLFFGQKTSSWHSESLMCCAHVGPKPWGHWTPPN